MGCAASRLENEDTVRQCRDRRRLMRDAVQSRHHLASAHADYLHALRVAGAALTAFARGEPLAVSDHASPILLSSPSLSFTTLPPPTPQPPQPPAPPPRRFSPSPSPTITSSKLPHILSASSEGSTPKYKPPPSAKRFTYATTPSSSVWDWDNFYPPSPPDSEYFDRKKREREEMEAKRHHLEVDEEEEEEALEREEVQCSEWDERYGGVTTSSSSDGGADEEAMREMGGEPGYRGIGATRSEYEGSSSSVSGETRSRVAPSEIGSATAQKLGRREGSEVGSFSTVRGGGGGGGGAGGLGLVVRHRDLAEIVAAIEEYFKLAASAGEPVSDHLESGRAQLDRSFRQLKKTVYHSSGVFSALASSWSSKPPLAVKYRLEAGALEESEGGKSHGSTLERLLAWEKKLYLEVKQREGVKIEHEKKLSTLQSQEGRGQKDEKLDKTKASIKKLQALIIVASQAVIATSSSIIKARDNELAPQLVDVCYSIMKMWRSMNQFHDVQNHIVQQVRDLVNRANIGEATSDLHRVATRDLESAISAWHSSFNRLIKHQRDYVHALHGWLRLTLSPLSSDGTLQGHSSAVAIELTAFCDEWKQALDRLPDTVVSGAIKSFVNVVHVISTKQVEELKIKKRAEAYSRKLEKKSAALRSIEKKFYHSYSMVGIGRPGDGMRDGNGQVFDTRDPLTEKKSEIAACRRKVEDEMARHMKAVEVTQSMTLNNIQTGLPVVFQAMTSFSNKFAEVLQEVCRRAGTPG